MNILHTLHTFIAHTWHLIAFAVGIGYAWHEHRRHCRERRAGKWWF